MNGLFSVSCLVEDLETTDIQLLLAILVLSTLACIQHYLALTRSSPRVPPKHLPHRPALQILFKPDDDLPVENGAYGAAATTMDEGDGISMFSEDVSWTDSTFNRHRKTFDSHSVTSASRTQTYASSTRHRRETKTSTATHHGLPDSFAPLLSSSEMQLLTQNLTADLIHACYIHATVKLKEGRHSIPLNKNELRPQFWIDTNRDNQKKGCQISASFNVGSQNLSQDADLNTATPTSKRSRPIVKNLELVFDPPLKLGNVAPTLLHFPTLFEDTTYATLASDVTTDTMISTELWEETTVTSETNKPTAIPTQRPTINPTNRPTRKPTVVSALFQNFLMYSFLLTYGFLLL